MLVSTPCMYACTEDVCTICLGPFALATVLFAIRQVCVMERPRSPLRELFLPGMLKAREVRRLVQEITFWGIWCLVSDKAPPSRVAAAAAGLRLPAAPTPAIAAPSSITHDTSLSRPPLCRRHCRRHRGATVAAAAASVAIAAAAATTAATRCVFSFTL
jgi:hypothetical protein